MADMEDNPLFGVSLSSIASSSSDSSSLSDDVPPVEPPSTTVLQTVNIKSHVPVILELADPNYDEWRCFFDALIGKFGLASHLSSPPTPEQRRDPAWCIRDQCILSWLYNSIARDVRAIVRVPKATTYVVWTAIHDQFCDNELHRAVYLEAEFRNLVQGDMTITQYIGKLKHLADALRDVGQPVHGTSQVLNMLRGLSSKYRDIVPVIAAKQPPHTFLSARSYLLLEEQYDKEQAKTAAHQALLTTGGPRLPVPAAADGGSGSGTGAQSPAPHPSAVPARTDGKRGRGRGRGRGDYQH
ncbi:unnamed protein product [Miscanthus lutarioriparius]|uniref:Retrotransposon gag domain-containing protein n=1 Tax=Miscanthus lutarioriparius TaxID=422564 RepID=A0A811NMD9_9POAL|nr:unnamed protein product [Miscanthus lutarioriparius]